MKTIHKNIFIVLLCVSYHAVTAQNLDSMPSSKRDSILISIAKEAILKYGPDYYREYAKPIIERNIISLKGEMNPTGINAGRISYQLTYLYDKTEETLEWDYAAKVSIWADTWHPSRVQIGTGFIRIIPEDIDWRNDTSIEPFLYQESIVPIYGFISIEIPDSITDEQAREEYFQKAFKEKESNQEPVNKDLLIRKGWEKGSDGEWVKTRPDTPPAEVVKVIERAKEEVRRKREMDNR